MRNDALRAAGWTCSGCATRRGLVVLPSASWDARTCAAMVVVWCASCARSDQPASTLTASLTAQCVRLARDVARSQRFASLGDFVEAVKRARAERRLVFDPTAFNDAVNLVAAEARC